MARNGLPLPLRIFETRYVDMVRYCMRERSPFGVVLIQSGIEVGTSGAASTCAIGTTARIVDFNSLPDGLLGITCIGERKFTVAKHWQQEDGGSVRGHGWFNIWHQKSFVTRKPTEADS